LANDPFKGLQKKYVIKARGKIMPKISLMTRISSTFTNEINKRIALAVNRATLRITVELKEALDEALRSNVWQWSDGIRDIYETGELLESGKVVITDQTITVIYDKPYAALVHYGGYITPYGNMSAEKVYLPARPWISAVLYGGGPVPRFDFERYYREAIEQEFR
jgi:phage gpG-like protein